MPHPRLILLLALCAACSESALSGRDFAASTSGGGSSTGDDDDDNANPDQPEQEEDLLALPPAQTERYVFVANPERDTVTRLNVRTLEVDTTPVGDGPDLVLTTPDWTSAVVFNRLASSVSIINAFSLETVEVPVRDDFNQMVMSPDGVWVTLFHDLARERDDDPAPEGLQSFNEASFVNLLTGEHFPMAVGFNPRMVRFSDDGSLAVVVSDAYLAMVDLTENQLLPKLIELTPDTLEPPEAEEVVLSPNGSFAYVRQRNASDLLVVDLDRRDVQLVPIGLNATDLDLSPDGAMAVIVTRDSRELWVLDANDPFAAADVLSFPDDLPLGSLLFDPTGRQAVLYTTASATARYTTWDVDTDELRTRSMVKPVTGMAITPTGESMLAFHTKTDAPGADPSPFSDAWAMTIFSLDDFRSNPLKLPAEPTGYANAVDGERGYFIMKDQPFLEVLDYRTMLPDELPLKSNPVYVGVLPLLPGQQEEQPPAWVSQDHELGRISFYDPISQSLETVTGFELNAAIE